MTKINLIKVAGLALLVAAAVFIQFRRDVTTPKLETRAGAAEESATEVAPDGHPSKVLGIPEATKEAVQSFNGMSPEEQREAQEPLELTEKDDPSDLITTLLTAPFNMEPGDLFSPKTNWRVLAYPPEYCDPRAYSKTFRRKGPGMEINIYSYAVPSTTEAKELLMAGDLKIFREIDQPKVLELLKSAGYEAKPTEQHLSSPGGRNWSEVFRLTKGDVSGLMYHEPHGGTTAFKLKLEHKDIGNYSYRGPKVKQISPSLDAMPRLVADLEKNGAEKLLGTDWEEIKPMLLRGVNMNTTVTIETLLAAKNTIDGNLSGNANDAVFMVLSKYLVDAMMTKLTHGIRPQVENGKQVEPPAELKLLDENHIGYKLEYMGESYAAVKNSLLPAYTNYPNSYWGQYAFMKEMENGFEDSGSYLPGIIKKGEEFLAQHGESPFLPRVLFLLGKANETAYSVDQSPDKYNFACSDAYCAELDRNVEKYRLNAIKYYTQLLSLPGGKEYEEHLRYILPKLKTKGSSYCSFYINCSPC